MPNAVYLSDGSFDFSGGVDSSKVTTLQSALTPHGLKRNELAWLGNATVRGGGITCRNGWQPRVTIRNLVPPIPEPPYPPTSDNIQTVTFKAYITHANNGDADAELKYQEFLTAAALPQGAHDAPFNGFTYQQAVNMMLAYAAWVHARNAQQNNSAGIGQLGLFQGGWIYDAGFNNPYLICSIGGEIYKILLEAPYTVTNLSVQFNLHNPPNVPMAFFCQGEEFLVIQAGDYAGQRTVPNPPPGVLNYTAILTNFVVPTGTTTNTVTLNQNYAGAIGDQVTIFGTITTPPPFSSSTYVSIGTFQITNIAANVITLLIVTSNYAGQTVTLNDVSVRVTKTTAQSSPTFPTLPLFWDGTTLRRSIGINTVTPASTSPGINEIPAANSMDYYMGRLWYAQGRTISAGDIVKGPSGTAAYGNRDSILNVTENPLCFGGDGFSLPSNAGNVRAITHTKNLNDNLGQGDLYFGSRKVIYRLQVPVTRADWIAADNNNAPKMTLAAEGGFYGYRSIVSENSDLFYRSVVGVRSLTLALLNFGQWGNTPISNNEQRIFPFEDRSMLSFCSGMSFNNRMWQTCLPVMTSAGVAFQGVMPLDFDLISTLQEKLPPAWEGIYEGIKFLQLYEGDFGGRQRSFSAVVSDLDGTIQIWELTDSDRFDDQDNPSQDKRITWYAEFPAFTWGNERKLKDLCGGQIWIDKLLGTAEITVQWRPDASTCWQLWNQKQICSAASTCEDVNNPVCYPEQPYRENYKFPVVLPKPPEPTCNTMNHRPLSIGYQHQVRITIKGWCRIRGLILYATEVEREIYEGLNR